MLSILPKALFSAFEKTDCFAAKKFALDAFEVTPFISR
jgi:hypothetical protein